MSLNIPQTLCNKEFNFVLLGKWNMWKAKGKGTKYFSPTEYEGIDKKVWKPLGKAPFEKEWEKNGYTFDDSKLQDHLNKGGNYGVIGGKGDIRILDIDQKDKVEEWKSKFKDTFMVQTGSGGLHIYFISDYDTNHVLKDGLGEFRANNYQVVGAGSTHPNGNEYIPLNNNLLMRVDKKEMFEVLKPYLRETTLTTPTTQATLKEKDSSRSGEEYKVVLSLLNKKKTKEEVFEYMNNYSKWSEAPAQYKEMTYAKAIKFLDSVKIEEPKVKPQTLQVRNFKDIFKIKKDKSFLVDEVIYPKTINMVFSPPAKFKSLLYFYMGISLATGKDWLGFKTKRIPVLYCDGENNDLLIRERTEAIYKGLDMKRKAIPFYLLKGGLIIDAKKNINRPFVNALEEEIKKHKIKFLIFDTLHRFAYYDENKSDDINILYNEVLNYFREKYGVTILFLHHSTKPDKSNNVTYRGSGDFLGMVDTAYSISRSGTSGKFTITCEKSRSGEREKIIGEVVFGEATTKFIRHSEVVEENQERVDKKKLSDQILLNLVQGKEYRQKEITEQLIAQEFNFGVTKEGSIKQKIIRALKFLDYAGDLKQNELTTKWYRVIK